MVQKRPNILIFMTDQQQAQVTLPGHPCRTPNLDRLAAEGLRFTAAYPPMAHCCPSRASFMTGLYPSQHGIHNNVLNETAINRSLKEGVETFSEKLNEAGYRMFYAGKWHVSGTEEPRDRGWEELYVTCRTHQYHGIRRELWKDVDPELAGTERGRGEMLRPGWGTCRLYGVSENEYHETDDYRIIRSGMEQLEDLRGSEEPWCLYIGIGGPHDPFIIPEKYAGMYDPDQVPLPPNYYDDLADKPGLFRRMRRITAQLTEQEVRESIAHYWGYCTMVDDMFGEVLETLERNGMKEDTLVLFLSDHGEMAGAHGLYCKGISQFDEGYRVPCVMRWPTGIGNPGRSVDEFVTMMDFAPTFIELAGAEALGHYSGSSLLPFMKDETPLQWRDTLFTQCNGVEIYYSSRMVKTKKYKFVFNPADVDELYDLEADPHEMCNLADREAMKPVRLDMHRRLWEHVFRYDDCIFNNYLTVALAEYGPAILNAEP